MNQYWKEIKNETMYDKEEKNQYIYYFIIWMSTPLSHAIVETPTNSR